MSRAGRAAAATWTRRGVEERPGATISLAIPAVSSAVGLSVSSAIGSSFVAGDCCAGGRSVGCVAGPATEGAGISST
ncbi:hypothetical protein BH24ACT8_BH24ACT8_19610 [soil metagenome]